jgi:hypothetical protein
VKATSVLGELAKTRNQKKVSHRENSATTAIADEAGPARPNASNSELAADSFEQCIYVVDTETGWRYCIYIEATLR